jgi:hypothetical protein
MLSGLHHAEPPLGAVRRFAAAALFVGAAAHTGFLAEVFVETALSANHEVPARLASDGQPNAEVFRTLDVVAGAAFVLAGPFLLRLAPVHRWGRLTAALVWLYGAVLLTRAALPPECLPQGAGRCADPTGRISELPVLLAGVQYVVSPLVVASWWRGSWKLATRLSFAVQFGLWAWLVVAHVVFDSRFAGLAARTQILVATALFLVGVTYVVRMGTPRRTRRALPRTREVAPCPG